MKFRFRHVLYSIGILSFIAIAFEATPIIVATAAAAPMTIIGKLDKLGLTYVMDEKGKLATFLAPGAKPLVLKKKQTTITNVGTQFWKDYGTYFGIKNPAKEIKLVGTTSDVSGITHMRYVQRLNGVPVFGGELVVNVKANKDVAFATGQFFQGLNVKTVPKIKQKAGDEAAVKYIKQTLGRTAMKAKQRTLYVLQPNLLDPSLASAPKLAWEVLLADSAGREYVYVDAQTGKVIWRGTDTKTLDRQVIDCRPDNGCFTGMMIEGDTVGRGEGDGLAADAEINDTYDALGAAHAYFSDVFHLNGANGTGGIGDGLDTFPRNSTTAFTFFVPSSSWPGCMNAFNTVTAMELCQGAATLGIVGHEYGHSVNHFQAASPLIYAGLSGAIEEAYADIWSQAIMRDVTGSSPWVEELGGHVIRDLANPGSGNRPATFYDPNFLCESPYTDTNDFGRVHHNSTVISHIAYLLSTGGDLNGCTVESIGQDKTERLFFTALRSVTRTTGFSSFAAILKETCNDNYGENTADCRAVRTAIDASEIDQFGPCILLFGKHVGERAPRCSLEITGIQQPDLSGMSRFVTSTPPVVDVPPEVTQKLPDIPVPTPTPAPEPPAPEKPTTPAPTPEPEPAPVVYDRTPVYDVQINVKGNMAYVDIKINAYGKGGKCEDPRYFDPVFVRWDDGAESLKPDSKNGDVYSFAHEYTKKIEHPIVIETVVTNECFGHLTKPFPIDVATSWNQ